MTKLRKNNLKAVICLLLGSVIVGGATWLLLYGFFCVEPYSNRETICYIIAAILGFIGATILMYAADILKKK